MTNEGLAYFQFLQYFLPVENKDISLIKQLTKVLVTCFWCKSLNVTTIIKY